MSVERVSNNYSYNKDLEQVSTNETEDNISVFDNKEIDASYSDIYFEDKSVTSQQGNNSSRGGVNTFSQEQLNQALTDYLENLVSAYEEQFKSVKENNGWIAKGWDWFKNATGIGAGSDKVQKEINELKKQIEELKKDPAKLNDVYKSVTGNELNDEELNNLVSGQVDLSHSKIVESVSKYTQGQKMCTNIISGLASSLAVVGLVAGGIVAAPFTGGMSLGASVAAIGTLTAAGTAAYMVPQVIDGVSEKDGYSFKEVMQDVSNGIINSGFTAIGMGAGKAVGQTLGKTAINKTVANLAASETTSLIIGDGIGIGNYLTEAAFNDDVDFSWEDLGKTAAVSTASSVVAGAVAYGVSSKVRPVLTSGTTAQSQIAGRLLSAGITGGSAGMSAAAVGGGTNYLLTCAIDGKEVSFDAWLNASTENLGTAALTGFIGGMAFEAVHLAAGTPKPEGTVKTVKGTNEDGLKYTNYLDKDGNVLATDISASDAAKIYGSANNEQGLTQYDGDKLSTEGKVYDTTRTIRVSYTNIPDVQSLGSQDGVEVFTQTPSDNYSADMTLHDWADNSFYLGFGVINKNNIPNPNVENKVINADYEIIYDEPLTPELNGNAVYTPQLTQGPQESGLVPAQNGSGNQNNNFNTQNADMVIVDTTMLQLEGAQQAQMANIQAQAAGVEAQTQGGIISANAFTSGTIAGGNNNPPTQVNPSQNISGSNPYAQENPPAKVNPPAQANPTPKKSGSEETKPLPPEIKEELTIQAQNINLTAKQYINEAKNQIETEFSDLESVHVITGRAKSEKSIFEKLEKKYKNGKLASTTEKMCKDAIGDAYGIRIQLKPVSQEEAKELIEDCLYDTGISYEKFVSYLDGDESDLTSSEIQKIEELKPTVLDLLKEHQTQEIVERLYYAIGEGRLQITELNNYGDDIASYFTARQIQDIADAYYIATGKKLTITTLDRFHDGNGTKVDINGSYNYTVKLKTDGAVKDSGYASAQMNVEHTFSDGTTGHGELQIRGTILNSFADAEHIPYDIRTGKITDKDLIYSDVFNIISKMTDETYEKYNEFLTKTYDYLRLQELGIETTKPVFQDSSLTPEQLYLLSPEGLVEVSKRGH